MYKFWPAILSFWSGWSTWYMFQNAQWLYEPNINPTFPKKHLQLNQIKKSFHLKFYPTCSQGNVSAGSVIGLGYLWYLNILKTVTFCRKWIYLEFQIRRCHQTMHTTTHGLYTHSHTSIYTLWAAAICEFDLFNLSSMKKKQMPKKNMVSDRLHSVQGPVKILICFFVVRRFPIRFKLVWMSRNPMRGQEFSNLGVSRNDVGYNLGIYDITGIKWVVTMGHGIHSNFLICINIKIKLNNFFGLTRL